MREYKLECNDSDWKCEALSDKDLAFDDRPSVLQVVSLQHDGAALRTGSRRQGLRQTDEQRQHALSA